MDAPDPMDKPSKFGNFPRYRCHKVVQAVRIAHIMTCYDGGPDGAIIQPASTVGFEDPAPFNVDQAFLDKHRPEVGGYFVVYADGYTSFSPAQAFEDGYARIHERHAEGAD